MANKKVDVVICGVGWVGGIIAHELTKAGLSVVGLERGHQRSIKNFQDDHDELAYAIRMELFQNTARETWTLRHNLRETALPIRQLGSFLPGTGLGGAGVHWNGVTWRFHARDFTIKTSTIDRYGASMIPPGMTIQDWGITYDEIEPYYDTFEKMAGIAGKAGNIKGRKIAGRQRLRGRRARPSTRCRRSTTRAPGRCSARRPTSSATTRSRSPRRTSPRATRTPTASPAAAAPTAASASASAARSARRPTRWSR